MGGEWEELGKKWEELKRSNRDGVSPSLGVMYYLLCFNVVFLCLPAFPLASQMKLVKLLLNRSANPRALSFQKELPIGEPRDSRAPSGGL